MYGSQKAGVILRVLPDGPLAELTDLHYWATEEVTVWGWSFGPD